MTKKKLSAILAGIVLFLIVALPSIKMVVIDTDILNLIPVFLIVLIFALQFPFKIQQRKLTPLIPFLLLFLCFFLSFFLNPTAFPGFIELLKYLVLAFLTLTLPVVATDYSLSLGLKLLFSWCLFIAVYQYFIGVPIKGRNFHYLTVGLPIGVFILISFSKIFRKSSKFQIITSIGFIALGYLSLFTLFGRSPLLFTTTLMLGFILFKVFISKSIKLKLTFSIGVLGFISGAAWIVFNYLPPFLLDRFVQVIVNPMEEPRIKAVYAPALEAISKSPIWGYGLSSSWEVIGFYPHNIFLEVLIDSGLIGLLFFLIIIIMTGISSLFFLKTYEYLYTNYLALILITLFHFLFWNVSYSITSAYGLFPLMAISSVKYFEKKTYIR